MYKTTIISNLYVDSNPERMKELITVFANNAALKANIIYVINVRDVDYFNQFDWIKNPNVYKSKVQSNPSFADLFRIIRNSPVVQNDSTCIVTNSDIMIPQDDLKLIEDNLQALQCYALSRWDMVNDNPAEAIRRDRIDSQDSWCFKGKPPFIIEDFKMGIPGCDNRLAYLIQQEGYKLYNPSKSIKTYHYHINLKRNRNLESPIEPPYCYVNPISLEELPC